jgi:hypothetical protein
MDDGKEMKINDRHSENAKAAIRCRLPQDENVTSEREEQPRKQKLSISSTFSGTPMDFNEEHFEKASAPILVNLESGSNMTSQSE